MLFFFVAVLMGAELLIRESVSFSLLVPSV
jgi:hypothetical protein